MHRTLVLMAMLPLLLLLCALAYADAQLSLAQEIVTESVRDGVQRHRLTPIALETSVPADSALVRLSVTCRFGSVAVAAALRELLTGTALACESYAPPHEVTALTTRSDAQRILAALEYDAPDTCSVPAHHDTLTVRVWASADADSVAAADAFARMRSDGCVRSDADVFAASASTAATALERQLVLVAQTTPLPAVTIVVGEPPVSAVVQGACALLPAIRIETITSATATSSYVDAAAAPNDALVGLTLRAHSGLLQLDAATALRMRVRVASVTLDPLAPPVTASSLALHGALTDLHALLATIAYCAPADAMFTADAVDVHVRAPGACSTVRADDDPIEGSTTLAVSVAPLVTVGRVTLFGGAGGSLRLVVLPADELAMPLALQFIPGTVDDVVLELQLDRIDGLLLLGVEHDALQSVLAVEQSADTSTFGQTLRVARHVATSEKAATVALTLRSLHSTWRTARAAALALPLADHVTAAAALQRALATLVESNINVHVACRGDFDAAAMHCEIEYRDVQWAAIPTVVVPSNNVAPSDVVTLSALRALDAHALQSCSVHIELVRGGASETSVSFQLTRRRCALVDDCDVLKTPVIALPTTLAAEQDERGAADALRALAAPGEDVVDVRAFHVPSATHNGVLFAGVPCSLARNLALTTAGSSNVKIWLLRREWRLRATKTRITAVARTAVRVYSVAAGARLHSSLNVTLQLGTDMTATATAVGAVADSPHSTNTFDIVALPNFQTVRLRAPQQLVVREADARATNLSAIAVVGPWQNQHNQQLRTLDATRCAAMDEQFVWHVRTRALGLVFDGFDPALASVVHRQHERSALTMRGCIRDFPAAMARVTLAWTSELQRDRTQFTATLEHQVVQLSTQLLPSPPTKTQTLTATTRTAGAAIAGSFTLSTELPASFYSAIDARVSSSFRCVTAPIARTDAAATVATKVLDMTCGSALSADFVSRREVQIVRVRAVFPALVHDLTGAFTLAYGSAQSSTPIDVTLLDAATMRLRVLEVLPPGATVDVSRIEVGSDSRAFEWRITFGAAGRASGLVRATPTPMSTAFTTEAAVAQRGLSAADVTLRLLFPDVTLRVRDASPTATANAATLVLEFHFGDVSPTFPDLVLQSSALVASTTLTPAVVRLSTSTDERREALGSAASVSSFRLTVFGRTTVHIAVNTDADDVAAAIRRLGVDKLALLSVERALSSSAPNGVQLYDWRIEASHPLLLDVRVSDASAQLAAAGVQLVASRKSRGREALVGVDTLSVALSTFDGAAPVLQTDILVRLETRKLDLAVHLPVAFMRVERNSSVVVDGITLSGIEIGLTLHVTSRRGGLLALVPMAHAQVGSVGAGSNARTAATSLTLDGALSELSAVLQSHRLVYSSAPDASAAGDEIELRLQAATTEAVAVLPVEINVPPQAPSLLLPTTRITAVEDVPTAVRGVTLSDSRSLQGSDADDSLLARLGAHFVRVHVRARIGRLTLLRHENNVWQHEIELTGSVDAVNAELKRLQYVVQSPADATHDEVAFTTFALSDNDDPTAPPSRITASTAKTYTLTIEIRARPATAQLFMDGEALGDSSVLHVRQDESVSLQRIAVGVVGGAANDSGAAQLELAIAAVHGVLSLNASDSASRRSDVRVRVTPSGIRLVSSVRSLNALLHTVTYTPRRRIPGPDELLLRLRPADSDTRVGSVAAIDEAVGVLRVVVTSVHRLPHWTWTASGSNVSTLRVTTLRPYALPPFALLLNDTTAALQLLPLGRDTPVLRATVRASTGRLTHCSVPTLDEPIGATSVVLEGRVTDLRTTLAQIRYQYVPLPPHHWPTERDVTNHSMTVALADVSHLHMRGGQWSSDSTMQCESEALPSTRVATLHVVVDASLQRAPLNLLRRDEMTVHEDADHVAVGAAFDLHEVRDYTRPLEAQCVAQSGQLHVPADERNSDSGRALSANSSLTLAARDGRRLQQLVAALLYAPPRDFNGVDVVMCRVLGQEAELFVHVQPVNDAPVLVFTADARNDSSSNTNRRDWFAHPAMLLPSLEVQDADAHDTMVVRVDAANGTLKWCRDVPRKLFDGVSHVGAGTSSLQFTSSLARVNALLTPSQLRFVPLALSANSSSSEGGPLTGAVRICVHDGTADDCIELQFPIQQFYALRVEAPALDSVVRGEHLALPDAIRVARHSELADRDVEPSVVLQIDTSTGAVLTRTRERELLCADAFERPSTLFSGNGVASTIRATSVACLNAVLATAVFVADPSDAVSTSTTICVQLSSIDMELFAADNFALRFVARTVRTSRLVVTPRAANASRVMASAPTSRWGAHSVRLIDVADVAIEQVTADTQTELLERNANAIGGDDDPLLELALVCARCGFFFATYVPGVSYEHATLQGAAAMRFGGSSCRLLDVLATLHVSLHESATAAAATSRREDTINLTLAPSAVADSNAQLGSARAWSDAAEFPVVMEYPTSVLEWHVADSQLVLFDDLDSSGALVAGLELRETDAVGAVASDAELTLSLACPFGSVRVTFTADAAVASALCAPHELPVTVRTTHAHVNRVLAGVRIAQTNRTLERAELQFAYVAADAPHEQVAAPLVLVTFATQPLWTNSAALVVNGTGSAVLIATEDTLANWSAWAVMTDAVGNDNGTSSDDNDSLLLVRLAVQHGAILIKRTVCCVHVRTTHGGRGVDVLGTAATLQTALDAVQYVGDADFAGNDTLRATLERGDAFVGSSGTDFSALDFAPLAALELPIFVAPVNDAPMIRYHRSVVTMHGNASVYSLEGVEISDVDIDVAHETAGTLLSTVRVTLHTDAGHFVVASSALQRLAVVSALRSANSTSMALTTTATDDVVEDALTQLVVDASVHDANVLLQRTLFVPTCDPVVCAAAAMSGFEITVDDLAHGLAAWTPQQTTLQVADVGCSADDDAAAATTQLVLPPPQHVTYDAAARTIAITGLSLASRDNALGSPRSAPPSLRVTGTCRFEVALEVQRVSLVAPRTTQELVLTIWDPNGASSAAVTGTFVVQADLSLAGLQHLAPTTTIDADAAAMRVQEVLGEIGSGRSVAASIEAKLMLLHAPLHNAGLRFHVDRVQRAMLPATARAQWRIAVLNASPPLRAPLVVSTNLVSVGAGASVTFVSSVVGAPLGGTFELQLGDEVTRALPATASSADVQDALEALAAVDVVKVTAVASTATSVSPSWLVTFFSPSERVPLLVGDARALVPSAKLSDADASVTLAAAAAIRVERVSTGKGQANVHRVVVGATRVDPVYSVTTSATSTLSGTFTLGFQDVRTAAAGLLVTTNAIVSDAVAMRADEGKLQNAGGRRGASMQSRLERALASLQETVWPWRDVRVECSRGSADVRGGYVWLVTFVAAPPDFPLLVVAVADRLGGANAQVVVTPVQRSNAVSGSFRLHYARDRITSEIAADATPDIVEAALNDALAAAAGVVGDVRSAGPSAPRASAGRVAVRKARVDGSSAGVSFGIVFLDEVSMAVATPARVILVADGALLTGIGAFARVDHVHTRTSTGSFELLAARIGDGWSGDLVTQFSPDAFVLQGSAASLRRAISTIVYTTPAQWSGTVTLQFALQVPSTRTDAATPHVRAVATAPVSLATELPVAEIMHDAFTVNAAGGKPRALDDFHIRIVGAAVSEWLKLRVTCDHGLLSLQRNALLPSSIVSSRTIWLNGTLAQIHSQLRNAATYVGAVTDDGPSAFDRLVVTLFLQRTQLTESMFLVRVQPPPVLPQLHIVDSIEGPFDSAHWQEITKSLAFGDTLALADISVGDANRNGNDSDDNGRVTLEVACEHGSVAFAGFDDLELAAQPHSSRLALTASLRALNAALARLHYRTGEPYVAHDTVRLTVRNVATRPVTAHTRRITLAIRPRELHLRVTLSARTYTGVEDTGFQFPDLTLAAVDRDGREHPLDAASSAMTFELRVDVSSGRFVRAVSAVGASSLLTIAPNASVVTVSGNASQLEAALTRLVFMPSPPNWNVQVSAGHRSGHVVQWTFAVQRGDRVLTTRADLLVSPRADAPVIVVPTSVPHAFRSAGDFIDALRLQCLPIHGREDAAVSLRGLSVRSADAGDRSAANALAQLRVSLSVAHGTIAIAGMTCIERPITVLDLQQPQRRVEFEATAVCASAAIATASYTGDPNFSGIDALHVHVVDVASALSDDATVPLVIAEVNDAPYLVTASTSAVYVCDEDVPLVLEDFSIVDPDARASLIRVDVRAAFGSLALLKQPPLPSTLVVTATNAGDPTAGAPTTLQLKGTLADVNSALAALVYTSARDWNSVDSTFDAATTRAGTGGLDAITVTTFDGAPFNSSYTSVRFVHVRPRADAVVISSATNVPTSEHAHEPAGTIHGDEDAPLAVHGLHFTSVDDESRIALTVTLEATHGTFAMPATAGVAFEDGTHARGSKRVHCRGTFAALNRAVQALTYVPDRDFNGHDAIHVTASTFDDYTRDTSDETTVVIDVRIDAINDAPEWDVSAVATVSASDSAAVVAIEPHAPTLIRGVQIRDVDATDAACHDDPLVCAMDVTLEVAHGRVTLPRLLTDAALGQHVRVDVQDAGTVMLSGSLVHLNAALREIVFELDDLDAAQRVFQALNEVGFVLTVDDRGAFGKGGPRVSSTVVYLALAGRDSLRGLALTAPTDSVLAMNEDAVLAFGASSVALVVVDADVALARAALLELTVATPHGAFALARGVAGVQIVANRSGELAFRGFLRQVNAALNGSAFVPMRDWYGTERIAISVVDIAQPLRRATAEIVVVVAPVCDEPTWHATRTAADGASIREGDKLLVDGVTLTCPDADADERDVRVDIAARHGGVMLATLKGLLLLPDASVRNEVPVADLRFVESQVDVETVVTASRLFFTRLAVRGRVRDVNAALRGLIYAPDRHFHSRGDLFEALELRATSDCGNSDGADSNTSLAVQMRIHAVNDASMLRSAAFTPLTPFGLSASSTFAQLADALPPPVLEAVEDMDVALEPLAVDDVDRIVDGSDSSTTFELCVTITCVHCSVRAAASPAQLQTRAGLFVTTSDQSPSLPDSTASARYTLVAYGSIDALNTALLHALVFRSARNFHGRAFVVVEVADLGRDGDGTPLTTAYAMAVRVQSVNDGPQIHVPPFGVYEPFAQVRERESLLLRGAPSVESLVAAQAVAVAATQSRVAAAPRRWSLMLAQPLARDSNTRLTALADFESFDALATGSFVTLGSGVTLFRAYTPATGAELWRTDGTRAGTALLRDIVSGPVGSEPTHLHTFAADGRAYFAARGRDDAWRVPLDTRDACGSFRQSAFDANVFYAIAASSTWDIDASYDCPLGFHWMSTAEALSVFVGTVAEHGDDREPRAYFNECGWRGYVWGGITRMYLRFADSWHTGAVKHVGYRDSYRIDTGSFATDRFAGVVCYRDAPTQQQQQLGGSELWATDGTAAGTRLIKRINADDPHGSQPSHFAELADRLFFQATSRDAGAELWVTDGSRAGTQLVADIESGIQGSEPRDLYAFNARLFFSAHTVRNGRELWMSDGARRSDNAIDRTASSTMLVLDICVGARSSEPKYFATLTPVSGSPSTLLLFQATDCVRGAELWATAGTAATTRLVIDIRPGSAGSNPSYLTAFAGRVYFQADDGARGAELWVTDGTLAGTTVLVDLAPGATGSTPSFLSVLASVGGVTTLVFAARAERDRAWEFWQTDGAATGTRKLFAGSREVADINAVAMDALATARFVQATASVQSFLYFGQQPSAWQLATATHLADVDAEGASDATATSRSITLVDVESDRSDASFTLRLSATKGRLGLGPSACGASAGTTDTLQFVTGAPREQPSAAITVVGSLRALNCAVERVTYHADANAAGSDAVVVELIERVKAHRSNGSVTDVDVDTDDGRLYATTQRIPLEILSVNDAPTVSAPASVVALLDVWTNVRGVAVADADAGDARVFIQLRVHSGRLRVNAAAATLALPPTSDAVRQSASAPPAVAGDARVLEFAATIADAKAIWQSLQYRCTLVDGCRDATRDYLTVYVDDNGFSGDGGARDATASTVLIIRAG